MSLSLAVHTKHDANLTLSDGKQILLFLELEKITKERYFTFSQDSQTFLNQWQRWVQPYLPIDSIKKVILCWVHPQQEEVLRNLFPTDCTITKAFHHLSHATSCYMFTQPMAGDLILSYDGGGDLEDVFRVFWNPDGTTIPIPIHEASLNLGTPYRLLGIFSPELAKEKIFAYEQRLDLPGKIMGLAAFGESRGEWKIPIQTYLQQFHQSHAKERKSLINGIRSFLADIAMPGHLDWDLIPARDLLATLQEVFEEMVITQLSPLIEQYHPRRILITGGCALNVTANSHMASTFGLPIFVPPCPNDCGISLGAMKTQFPDLALLSTPYLGPSLSGFDAISELGNAFHISPYSIDDLARRLFEGAVLGVLKGPIEIGPRALGHRSILASPLISGMKDKLNRIKKRAFYRPVAPMILESAYDRYFYPGPPSPYMSFAPLSKPSAKAIGEGIHQDDTARIQTVSSAMPFLHDLLTSFQKYSNHPVLLNTSFNTKGNPLLNDLKEAIHLLTTTSLDGLVVEEILIEKQV